MDGLKTIKETTKYDTKPKDPNEPERKFKTNKQKAMQTFIKSLPGNETNKG